MKKSAADVLGKKNVYIIEEDNLGGENFAEYSSRVPAVYMFIGIKPEEKEAIPGLHSPKYQFDVTVLAGARLYGRTERKLKRTGEVSEWKSWFM